MFTLLGVRDVVRSAIAVLALICVALGVAPAAYAMSPNSYPTLTITGGPCSPFTIKGSNLPTHLSTTATIYDSNGKFFATVTLATDGSGAVNATIPVLPNGQDKVVVAFGRLSWTLYVTVACGSGVNGGGPGGGVATPELGSGELVATGLLPVGIALLFWRRARRRAQQKREHAS